MKVWKVEATVNNNEHTFVIRRHYKDGLPFGEEEALPYILQHIKRGRPKVIINNIKDISHVER